MGRNLLILLLDGASRAELEAALEERGEGYPSVYVVVPAQVGALDWLATDERHAQDAADVRALEAEWLLAGHAEIGGGEAGNPDPVQAVADALRALPGRRDRRRRIQRDRPRARSTSSGHSARP